MDENNTDTTKQITILLEKLYENKVLTQADIAKGFREWLKDLDDQSVDMPLAPKWIAQIAASLAAASALNIEFLRDGLQHLNSHDARAALFIVNFVIALDEKLPTKALKMWQDADLHLRSFFKDDEAFSKSLEDNPILRKFNA